MRNHQGFSIVEVMLTISLFVILLNFSIPLYNNYIIKTHRAEAKLGLIQLAIAQENHRMSTTGYADDISSLGPTASSHGLYRFVGVYGRIPLSKGSCTPESGIDLSGYTTGYNLQYTLIAIPNRDTSQVNDTDCACLYIDDLGQKGSTGAESPEKCWN
ncbi:MAG: prepilin-type N-terminal cleavage/methylation domain-containing protein [Endozoicomonadaceae bacterium]|nr:prepilin-type N-terminal cleavage/methylation domain-containing protein [Endozoicomonadaceae bacterium]